MGMFGSEPSEAAQKYDEGMSSPAVKKGEPWLLKPADGPRLIKGLEGELYDLGDQYDAWRQPYLAKYQAEFNVEREKLPAVVREYLDFLEHWSVDIMRLLTMASELRHAKFTVKSDE